MSRRSNAGKSGPPIPTGNASFVGHELGVSLVNLNPNRTVNWIFRSIGNSGANLECGGKVGRDTAFVRLAHSVLQHGSSARKRRRPLCRRSPKTAGRVYRESWKSSRAYLEPRFSQERVGCWFERFGGRRHSAFIFNMKRTALSPT